VVWDHQRSRIVWIGHGKDRDTLDAFFRKLGQAAGIQTRVAALAVPSRAA
jgi:hypothetical protein